MEAAATAKETTSYLKRKNSRWDNDMVQHLINSLLENKRLMTYENLAFDTDKPMQYKELWIIRGFGFGEYMVLILQQELQNPLLACGSLWRENIIW